MSLIQILLLLSALLCSLVAGFLFAFAVVVMPGIAKLSDRDFLRAFQVIDGIIQDNSPSFLVVWVGSAVSLIAAAAVGFGTLDSPDRWALLLATTLYLLGVQAPTVAINIPLNNRVQSLELDSASDSDCHDARADFEPRWNRWNRSRTWVGCFVVVLLMFLMLRS